MKTSKLLTVIAVTAVIGFLSPAIASASHGHHSSVGISIGVGVPIYSGYGYWSGPCYYPYYPRYPRAVYVPPPYYPPVVVSPPVVVAPPVVVTQPVVALREDAITSYVNVTNSNGSFTPVRIRRMGTVWVGPKGEQYLSYPTVEQLRPVYGF